MYHRVSAIPANAKMQPRRVIDKAIHRTSKPDLAIEVASQAGQWGVESIPPLLKRCSLAWSGWPEAGLMNREATIPVILQAAGGVTEFVTRPVHGPRLCGAAASSV